MPDRADGHSLRALFAHHAATTPDAPAFVIAGKACSYGKLQTAASRWAGAILRTLGRRPERIGVFAYRSETAYTGTLAALYAGAAWVPLNPTFPPEKTAAMAARADLDAVIVDAACMPHVEKVFAALAGVLILTPEGDSRAALEAAEPPETLPPLTPEDTAYLLFTSGSTGEPKGVPVTHGNALAFLAYMSRRYEIRPSDRLSQTFDQTFDLSVFDLFMAWTNGACVYAMSPVDLLAPARFINRNELTLWFSVPSVPVRMMRRGILKPGSLPTLRLSLFCGEPLTRQTAEAWQAAAPQSVLENLYGPTELTIACCLHRWDPAVSPELCRNGVVPIGRPYDGLIAAVVDDQLREVPPGESGELCISGAQTAPGYWRAPEITAERFVALPVSRHETRRFYRTGDLVSRLASGEYVFLGRADQQIKVLGHRVELGEIEEVLRRDPSVDTAVALPWPSPPAMPEGIVAFVSGSGPDPDALTELAKAHLPPYIVPQRIFVTAEMPLNANGKVDRGVLRGRMEAELSGR